MYMLGSTNGRLTMSQETDTPNGFANSLKLDCTTADTSIGSTEYGILAYHIEGQDLQQLKKGTSDAEKITVSFYVKGNANATYTCELKDSENNRQNSQEFNVTTSWNRVILTFDGDTTGALSNDTSGRLYIYFWLHAGSGYTSATHTDNVWHTADNQRVGDNATSILDSTDRTFFLTGLQMEVGSQATPFEHRSFGEELALCQRYYYKETSVRSLLVYQEGSVYLQDNHYFPMAMRTSPTATLGNTHANSGSVSSSLVANISTTSCIVAVDTASTGARIQYSNLALDAEL
jgi:hypothetical protein